MLRRLGGVATRGRLLEVTTRRRLEAAVRQGAVVRVARGRYALPGLDEARRRATELSGVLALRSAALAHGWALKEQPGVPEIAVPAGRRIVAERREDVRMLWTDLADDMVEHGTTTPWRTVVDCARRLPFDEALAVADSALRSGSVTGADLVAITVRGAGAAAVRRVVQAADARAANPFESVLRALCLDAGLAVEPQAPVQLGRETVHPDLVVRAPSWAIEADSWTFHTGRRAHRRDCARYNALGLAGWTVFRFTWEQVMHEQAYVRWVLARLAAQAAGRRVGHEEPGEGLPVSA